MGIDSFLSWIFFFFLIGSALVTGLAILIIVFIVAINKAFQSIEERFEKGSIDDLESR